MFIENELFLLSLDERIGFLNGNLIFKFLSLINITLL